MKYLCVLLLVLSPAGLAQTQGTNDTCGAKHLKQCALDILHDQAGIWTSPLRIHAADTAWLLPFAGAGETGNHPKLPICFCTRAAVDQLLAAAGVKSQGRSGASNSMPQR